MNKRFFFALAALLVACGVSLSSGSALAREAESGSNSGSNKVANTSSSENENETETEHATETEKSKTLKEQFRQMAQSKVREQAKTQAKAKSAEQKQKACEARKANLTKRMNNSVAAAERHKKVFDNYYTKVKNFYVTKKLNVENYATLSAAVDTAQQDAADKIAALKALDIDVDCTQTDSLATNLTAFKEAVSSTRDSLKSYRKSLVDLITQIHGASTSTDKNTSDNSSTNSTEN